jgi:hypothetical protein
MRLPWEGAHDGKDRVQKLLADFQSVPESHDASLGNDVRQSIGGLAWKTPKMKNIK